MAAAMTSATRTAIAAGTPRAEVLGRSRRCGDDAVAGIKTVGWIGYPSTAMYRMPAKLA
jgi:predicted Zn-dependent protease